MLLIVTVSDFFNSIYFSSRFSVEKEESFNYLWLLTLILVVLVIVLLFGFLYYK